MRSKTGAICNAPDRDIADGEAATDAAEAPTDRQHALVQKTWMPWRSTCMRRAAGRS